MKTNNRVKTNPNGEKIKGNSLLSMYVSKNINLLYPNEIDNQFSRICLIKEN